MIRSIGALSALLAICPFGLYGAGPSAASPQSGDEQCSFVLDPPKVVNISGTNLVTASVHTGSCTMHAHTQITVCLSVEGGDSAGQCSWAGTPNPATVYYPYRQGATYVVKGQGCITILEGSQSPATPAMVCHDILPSSVTL
jgi:hypothetical protein